MAVNVADKNVQYVYTRASGGLRVFIIKAYCDGNGLL